MFWPDSHSSPVDQISVPSLPVSHKWAFLCFLSFLRVGGKVVESTMLPSEVLSSSLSTRPAYSDMIDLTSCLGPKVESFNKKCLNPSERIQLLAKAEFRNPASQSHKDRIARAMIVKAEERGELTDSYGNKKASTSSVCLVASVVTAVDRYFFVRYQLSKSDPLVLAQHNLLHYFLSYGC